MSSEKKKTISPDMDENVLLTLSTVFDNSSKLRFTVIATARLSLFLSLSKVGLFDTFVCPNFSYRTIYTGAPPIHGTIGGAGINSIIRDNVDQSRTRTKRTASTFLRDFNSLSLFRFFFRIDRNKLRIQIMKT